jgi:hypothetical protein
MKKIFYVLFVFLVNQLVIGEDEIEKYSYDNKLIEIKFD